MTCAAILYITWNRLELTRRTLPRLLDARSDIPYDVYIYDNGSTDGTVEYLKAYDNVTYRGKNDGIASVQNAFWRIFSDCAFLGKIDNDIIVPDHWITECAERLRDKRVGIVSLLHWPWVWSLHTTPHLYDTGHGLIAETTHVGGNYLTRGDVVRACEPVKEGNGLKMGFTSWQWKARGYKKGFVYPFMWFDNLGGEGNYSLMKTLIDRGVE